MEPSERHRRHEPAGSLKPLAHAFFNVGAQQDRLPSPALKGAAALLQFCGCSTEQDHAPDPSA